MSDNKFMELKMNYQILTDARMKAYFRQIKNKICPEKPNGSNHFVNAFKLFKINQQQRLTFMTNECYEKQAENFIKSLYIFKLHTQIKEGYNFGIYVQLYQYAPRGSLDRFMRHLINFMTEKEDTEVKSVRPKIKSGVSLYDYIKSLYVHPRNLLLSKCSATDAISAQSNESNWLNHTEMNKLVQEICGDTKLILANIIAFPARYSESKLNGVLNLDENGFKHFMRQTTLQQLIQDICWDAYSIALQQKTYNVEQSQQLLDPLTRRSLVIKCIDEKITRELQLLIQNQFGNIFVHPHPFVNFEKKDLAQKGVFDGILFDPKFMISFLMCARWFARMCMQDTTRLSNNHGHLLLYGQSGAGKSLILSTIASNIPTYTYLTNGRFQNPDILQASILHIDEFDTLNLVTNHYKQLLDLKSSVKIDFKNLHPENVSKDVPCILSTNDDVLTVLKGVNQIKGKRGTQVNQYSIDAAIRRMYLVPFKLGQYDKLHGKLSESHAYYEILKEYNFRFENETHKLDRLFNMMIALGLYQQDIQTLQFNGFMQQYLQIVMDDFKQTIFGKFFIQNKKKVDDIVSQIEQQMILSDINDTEYITCVTISAGQLEYLYKKFIKKFSPEQTELVKDTTIPWPIKMYHIFDENNFLQNEHIDNNNELLGKETAAFLADDNYCPFVDDIEELVLSNQASLACSESFRTNELIQIQERDEHIQRYVQNEQNESRRRENEDIKKIYNANRTVFDFNISEYDYRDALMAGRSDSGYLSDQGYNSDFKILNNN